MKMFLGRPVGEIVDQFLSAQLGQEFSYLEVGMTTEVDADPTGYTRDHYRVRLGEGAVVFEQAVTALRDWRHFDLGWLNVCNRDVPIEIGSVVGLLASWGAFWLLFACRIVYVVKEDGPMKKYGFAYGTLPGHPECGEERFTVEWDGSDNSVWYEILAFSHPASLITRAAYPLTRSIQRRFARDSQMAMLAATVGAS
jgi:uncharacterized protein (UPF0548 family)